MPDQVDEIAALEEWEESLVVEEAKVTKEAAIDGRSQHLDGPPPQGIRALFANLGGDLLILERELHASGQSR